MSLVDVAAAARGRALYALAFPAFRRLWLGAAFESFGTWIERLAVGWFVLNETGSVFLAALSFAVRMAPNMLLGPFGGAIADRFSRPRVLMTSTATRAALLTAMACVVFAGVTTTWPLFVLVAMGGVARASEPPATQALVADIVGLPRAASAIGLHAFGVRTVAVVGSFAGGVLIEVVGPGTVFLVAAAAAGAASLTYSTLRVPRAALIGGARGTLWSDAIAGLRQVLHIPVVLALLVLALGVEVFAFSYQALMPGLAERVLHVGARGLGTLTLCAGLGGIAGTAALAMLGDSVRRGRLLIVETLVFGGALIAFAASEHFVLSLVLVTIVGAMAAMFDALQWVLLQANVPDEIRGRVIGTWMAAIGFGWLGPLTLGAAAEVVGIQWAVAGGGVIACALASGAACNRALRRL